MAKEIKMPLPSAADLFSTQEERDNESRESVREIPLEEISDFPNHPFKVKMDESMADMAESVKQYGVLVSALVREKPEGGYEIEAVLIMVDSNLQREQILPSEKAFAYKMKLDAMKRQAGRPCKNNSVPVGQNFGQTSRELLAEKSPDSNTQIQRYIRLTELITPILDMVDSGKIAIRPAVELSYLPKEQQTVLLDTMQLEDCTPSHAQAIKMRKFADEGRLNEDVILSILSEEKGNQKEQFRMPKERISKYFSPGTPAKQMEDTIVKALELYRKRERSKDRER